MARFKLAVVSMAAIIVTLLAQPAYAFYSVMGRSTNVLTTGDVRIAIVETMNGMPYPKDGISIMPGSIVSKEVAVQNEGNHPCWLRIALTNGIDNATLSADVFSLNINEEDWLYYDGFYYYKNILLPQESTSYLFTKVTIAGSESDDSYQGAVVTLTVNAYAVQSQNNDAVSSVIEVNGWPEVQGGSDG